MNQFVTVKTLKFKLYRHRRNRALKQQIDIAGIIWNHCIALHRRYYRLTGKHINKFELMKHIAKLKKVDRYSFWKVVGSQAIQDVVERVARAYTLFFNNLKRGIKTAPPDVQKGEEVQIVHPETGGLEVIRWKQNTDSGQNI